MALIRVLQRKLKDMTTPINTYKATTIILIGLLIATFFVGYFVHNGKVKALESEKTALQKQYDNEHLNYLQAEQEAQYYSDQKDSISYRYQLSLSEIKTLKIKAEHDEIIKLVNLYTIAEKQHYFDVLTGKATADKSGGIGQRTGK